MGAGRGWLGAGRTRPTRACLGTRAASSLLPYEAACVLPSVRRLGCTTACCRMPRLDAPRSPPPAAPRRSSVPCKKACRAPWRGWDHCCRAGCCGRGVVVGMTAGGRCLYVRPGSRAALMRVGIGASLSGQPTHGMPSHGQCWAARNFPPGCLAQDAGATGCLAPKDAWRRMSYAGCIARMLGPFSNEFQMQETHAWCACLVHHHPTNHHSAAAPESAAPPRPAAQARPHAAATSPSLGLVLQLAATMQEPDEYITAHSSHSI